MREALLALEDGTLFYGKTKSQEAVAVGQVVFNTSLTGYQEACTDPSYAGQLLLFTTSHVGNVGVCNHDLESPSVFARGIIVKEMCSIGQAKEREESFPSFLYRHHVPWIEGIDTRRLTRHLREKGPIRGCLMTGSLETEHALALAKGQEHAIAWPSLQENLYNASFGPTLLLYDFGVKRSLVTLLRQEGYNVTSLPHSFISSFPGQVKPDGVILSNGPGDPAYSPEVTKDIYKLLQSKTPVVGICLGCQLLALALGGKTKRMKLGHHGTNHPIIDLKSKQVYITSQNHDFVIDEASLPSHLVVTHRSLLDNSIQGITSKNYPILGLQGHPEGSPGPSDTKGILFDFLSKAIICPMTHPCVPS